MDAAITTRISRDIQHRLRIYAFILGLSQQQLLDQIVGEWCDRQPAIFIPDYETLVNAGGGA